MQELLVICDNLIKIYRSMTSKSSHCKGWTLKLLAANDCHRRCPLAPAKSTLLNILGGLDTPSAGRAIVAGHDLTRLSEHSALAIAASSSAMSGNRAGATC